MIGENLAMAQKVTPRLKREPPTYFFRAWRRYRGLTQEQLAERVGLGAPSISQIENGKQGFTDSTLLAFAEALTCEPGDLLSRDPNLQGAIADLLALIKQKDAQTTVMAFLNALPDRTGTGD